MNCICEYSIILFILINICYSFENNLKIQISECPESWIGDGFCDISCLQYNNDQGDCNGGFYLSKYYCNNKCKISLLGDGICDTECNVEECQYDNGDCNGYQINNNNDNNIAIECSIGCRNKMIGDGICDTLCNAKECQFDMNDCKKDRIMPYECSIGCLKSMLYDDICNLACNVSNCLYDNGKCLSRGEHCSNRCKWEMIGDGICQKDCLNSIDCSFDSGDCTNNNNNNNDDFCSIGCLKSWTDDGKCDYECNNEQCKFDGNDCSNLVEPLVSVQQLCNIGCEKTMIGDGNCDISCLTQSCLFDGMDCHLIINGTTIEKNPIQFNQCSKGCPIHMIGDNWCSKSCNVKECNYDSNDCQSTTSIDTTNCDTGCTLKMLGNDFCDLECNNYNCQFDYGDCISTETTNSTEDYTYSDDGSEASNINNNDVNKSIKIIYDPNIIFEGQCQTINSEQLKVCDIKNSTFIHNITNCQRMDNILIEVRRFRRVGNDIERECFEAQSRFLCSLGCVVCIEGEHSFEEPQKSCFEICSSYRLKCVGIQAGTDLMNCATDPRFSTNPLECSQIKDVHFLENSLPKLQIPNISFLIFLFIIITIINYL